MLLHATVLLTMFLVAPAFAKADVCAQYCDYICRHYRQDLTPVNLRLDKVGTNFSFYVLKVKIKNSGDVTYNPDGEDRSIKVSVAGLGTVSKNFSYTIPAQQFRWVSFGKVSPRLVKACSKKKVNIDYDKLAGQWGCNIFSNDTKILTVMKNIREGGCRSIMSF